MALNGSSAGLVSVTAGPDLQHHGVALIVGGVGGALVVFAVPLFDKLKIDDVVGAVSAHLVAGIWGTLAVGIRSEEHTSELQSLMRISYADFCLKKKKKTHTPPSK